MKRIILSFLLAVVAMGAMAQGEEKAPVSTDMGHGRYEYIESDIVRRLSFLIDKVEGRVWMVVVNELDYRFLKELFVDDKPTCDPAQINYQLYMGGIAARDCYLTNILTGQLWQLVETDKGLLYFQQMTRNDGPVNPYVIRDMENGRFPQLFDPEEGMEDRLQVLRKQYKKLCSRYCDPNSIVGNAYRSVYAYLYARPSEENISTLETISTALEYKTGTLNKVNDQLKKADTDMDRIAIFLEMAKK